MEFEQLGPYRIVRELGRGGMGTVFEGVNIETDEPAAVKLLSPTLAAESGFRDRFEAEIEVLRKLNHPNIVRLFGFGEQGEQLFYAMELVDGASLETEFSRGRRFDWREVTQIAIDTCLALRHAHDRGIIHRDLKPGNLLLTGDGQLKLSDFGIARLFGQSRQTVAGSVMGTAEFMSPEQADGRPTGPRSDLYSLGAVMYVLLARRQLFEARSFREMLEKQCSERPDPIGKHAPDTPLKLQEIIGRLLEKDPAKRIPNAGVAARLLEAMQQSLAVPPEEGDLTVSDGPPPHDPNTTDLHDPEGDPSEQPSADQTVTRVVDHSASSDLPETRATGPIEKPADAGQDPARHNGRFTVVEDDQRDVGESPPAKTPWISLQTWLLLAALIGVAATIRYFLQDPTADELYDRIQVQAADRSPDSLLQVEQEIRDFLMLYPEDSRSRELRRYEKEIELIRLDRKFELFAKGVLSTESLVPIELDYLEAINYARLDPELGLVKLEALVNLYGREEVQAGPTGNCLELARWRLEKLHEQLDEKMRQHAEMVKDRLDEADRLAASDPERARAIYEAVLELYNNKPWAATVVERAREALRQSEQITTQQP